MELLRAGLGAWGQRSGRIPKNEETVGEQNQQDGRTSRRTATHAETANLITLQQQQIKVRAAGPMRLYMAEMGLCGGHRTGTFQAQSFPVS